MSVTSSGEAAWGGSEQSMIKDPPLCVDLDGTLIRTDSLAESILALFKRNVWLLPLLPFWLLSGRAAFKARIAAHVYLDPSGLPYNEEVLAELRRQRAAGRRIALVTAADIRVAQTVANHVGLFTHVFASDGETNLKSSRKAERLIGEFGEGQFDYIGDSSADIAVWARARRCMLARPSPWLERHLVVKCKNLNHVFGRQESNLSFLRELPRMLRLHQWIKNLLVFVPLLTSLNLLHLGLFAQAALAFLIFGLCASSVYVTNDLLDLAADRRHPRKRDRSFASGRVSLWTGFLLAPALLLAGAALSALYMQSTFAGVLAMYVILTIVYSIYFKQIVLIDVVILAALYTLRIIAGAFAVQMVPSFWLLAFSMFIFLSLALVKRFAELQEAMRVGTIWIAGRGYKSTDIQLLMSLGTASGYVAVLVLALYINSEEVKLLYQRPFALWLLCPLLLYWIARMWMQAERSNMHDDPLVFAAKDRVTLAVAGLSALVILFAAWPL